MNQLSITIITILGACSLLSSISTANATSFDCAKASNWTEKTICSTTELSKLDEVMAKQYKAELASASDYDNSSAYKISVRNEQRNWLKFQRNTCKSKECLIREYKERISKNNRSYPVGLNRSELPSKWTFGTFYEDVNISVYNPDKTAWDDALSTTNLVSIDSITNKPYNAVINSVLIFTNAHTCVIDNKVAVWAENHWSIEGYEGAELRLYPATNKNKTQLLLRDINQKYQNINCGMRGYFDGKVFESK